MKEELTEQEVVSVFTDLFIALKQKFDANEISRQVKINQKLESLKNQSIDFIKYEINKLSAETALRLDDDLIAKVKKVNEIIRYDDDEFTVTYAVFASTKLGDEFEPYEIVKRAKDTSSEYSFEELTDDLDRDVDFFVCTGYAMKYVTKESVAELIEYLTENWIVDEGVAKAYKRIFK